MLELPSASSSSIDLWTRILAGAIALPLVWFVIGPVWVQAIDYLASIAP